MNKFSIEIEGLNKEYSGEGETVHVLNDVNIQVSEGSIISVEGASGTGKSTLLNIIGTIDKPTSGIVRLLGKDTNLMTAREKEIFRSVALGLIFQNHYLLPDFTVIENVMMPLLIQRRSKSLAREEAARLLEMVGLGHRFEHFPNQISGGEMARCGVARALVGDKKIILADEPTGNLDKQNSDKLVDLIFSLHEKLKFTLLMVTHDLDLAKKIPLRYILQNGILKPNG